MGSFSPVPGIVVDRRGKHVRISGTLEATGPAASAANAATAQTTIRSYWNRTFADGYRVSCDVSVRYLAPGAEPSGVAQIVMEPGSGTSAYNSLTDNVTLYVGKPNALTWTIAHEFGHQLGLDEHYDEGFLSKLGDFLGLTRRGPPESGWEHNLMAARGGSLDSRNVREIGEENAPSYFTDDDQIRLWVSRHRPTEIGALSTATKIRMLNVLLDGWIADEDVAAIASICAAVSERRESTAVKRALRARLVEMKSEDQRARVRFAIGRMP